MKCIICHSTDISMRRVVHHPSPILSVVEGGRGAGACPERSRRGESHYLVYRGVTREGRKTAVIWRDTVGWEQANYERDKQFVAERKLAEGADDIYVNGDSLIPGARALEGLFKARMFAEVEA